MSWVRRAITALSGVLLLALAILYGGSGLVISRHIDADLPRIRAASDSANLAEGARIAGIEGCTRCHGSRAQGRLMSDVPSVGHIVAPSLPRIAAMATDGQLARAIRNGVGIDARPLYIMPSRALNRLSDDDLARLMGWIRALPTSAFDVVGTTPVGVRGRFAILTGRLLDSVARAHDQPAKRPADVGRYFAEASCGQCHAIDHDQAEMMRGSTAPALAHAASAYDPAALRTLLRTGKGIGGRSLPAMSEASKAGLGGLSDGEIDAIGAYLHTVAGKGSGR